MHLIPENPCVRCLKRICLLCSFPLLHQSMTRLYNIGKKPKTKPKATNQKKKTNHNFLWTWNLVLIFSTTSLILASYFWARGSSNGQVLAGAIPPAAAPWFAKQAETRRAGTRPEEAGHWSHCHSVTLVPGILKMPILPWYWSIFTPNFIHHCKRLWFQLEKTKGEL